MDRVPEPELMNDAEQARAYAEADFAEPHERFVDLFTERHSDYTPTQVLDLGCGPGDVTMRFARRFGSTRVVGVDGSPAMLAAGQPVLKREPALAARIDLVQGYLPGAALPSGPYDAVISNSLLHHLDDPLVIWNAIKAHGAAGARVFVMDLMRPDSRATAEAMVEQHAAGEPEVLRHDFFHSLLAAYTIDEVQQQLAQVELQALTVEAISDRHLIVHGRLA